MKRLFRFYYITDTRFKKGWWISFSKLTIEERFILSVYLTDILNRNEERSIHWQNLIPKKFRTEFLNRARAFYDAKMDYFEFIKKNSSDLKEVFRWRWSSLKKRTYDDIAKLARTLDDLIIGVHAMVMQEVCMNFPWIWIADISIDEYSKSDIIYVLEMLGVDYRQADEKTFRINGRKCR